MTRADAEVVDRLDIGFADRVGQRFAQGLGDGGALGLGLQPQKIDDDQAAEIEGADDTADFGAGDGVGPDPVCGARGWR